MYSGCGREQTLCVSLPSPENPGSQYHPAETTRAIIPRIVRSVLNYRPAVYTLHISCIRNPCHSVYPVPSMVRKAELLPVDVAQRTAPGHFEALPQLDIVRGRKRASRNLGYVSVGAEGVSFECCHWILLTCYSLYRNSSTCDVDPRMKTLSTSWRDLVRHYWEHVTVSIFMRHRCRHTDVLCPVPPLLCGFIHVKLCQSSFSGPTP